MSELAVEPGMVTIMPSMTEVEARIYALMKALQTTEETVQSLRDDMDGLTGSMEVFVAWINDETALARLEDITCRLEAVFAQARLSKPASQPVTQQQLFAKEES